jgi:hypothetical protein
VAVRVSGAPYTDGFAELASVTTVCAFNAETSAKYPNVKQIAEWDTLKRSRLANLHSASLWMEWLEIEFMRGWVSRYAGVFQDTQIR